MTIDQHIHALVWDLIVRVAQLSAEVDALNARLATLKETPDHGQ